MRKQPERVVSGEELRAVLKVSRTAVWKQINQLRISGYIIESLPAQGYRLIAVPDDKLVPTEISTGLTFKRIGTNIICYQEVDSTNVNAFQLAENGEKEGTVIVADSQRRGKGRLGRDWESPAGVNIYCSIILRPDIFPLNAFQLTFLSAVAVARTIENISVLKTVIKWPNDILINGRKVAGLLNEMSAETEKVNFLILGIGVNLNMRNEQFPDTLRHPSSSLFIESGLVYARNVFLRRLLAELDELYDDYLSNGYQNIRNEWQARCNLIGRKIKVDCNGIILIGDVIGTDDFGALLLKVDDGSSTRILAGDVSLI